MNQSIKPTIVVLDDYERNFELNPSWGPITQQADVRVSHLPLHGQALLDFVHGAHALVLNRDRTTLDQTLLDHVPDLKLVSFTGTRNAAIDIPTLKERGVAVAFTEWGPSKDSTAELTWTLLLAAFKRLPNQTQLLDAGQWRNAGSALPVLKGKTLGLVGLGEIGSRVANYAKAFGMQVLAWSPNMTPERALAQGAISVSLEQLLQQSDVVSLHLVASASTKGLMNAERLGLMQKHSLLINTSRSSLINTPDLIEALHAGRLGAAALDVYDQEPLPAESPLRSTPNLLLTPHLGFIAEPVLAVFKQHTLDNLQAWLNGQPLPRLL